MRNKQAQTKKDSRGDGGDVAGKLTYPPELRCPSWCRTFKRRDGVVPFDVCPIVPSPEQEVSGGFGGKANGQSVGSYALGGRPRIHSQVRRGRYPGRRVPRVPSFVGVLAFQGLPEQVRIHAKPGERR